MASQALIFQIEQHIINYRSTIEAALDAVQTEARINTPPGTLYPENRDAWGTLAINLSQLHKHTVELGLALNNVGQFNQDFGL